jgi:LysR family transcriptional activator of nhaA
MSLTFSYRHLYYFWVVAKEGSITRAAARLDMAVQTVSTQVRELERSLGHSLLKPAGRGLVLTEAGIATMRQADQIFHLGEQLPEVISDAISVPGVRLAIGISDGLPKLVVRRLMQPVLEEPNLRLFCYENEFDDLLGDLALHRIDAVLADRVAPPNPNLKLYSHPVGTSTLAWYAPPSLLPTSHVAARARIDQWFERLSIRPRVVGEFEDSALLKTFGASGMGVFPAAEIVHDGLVAQYKVKRVGACEGVEEQFFLIVAEKKTQHPLIRKLQQARHQ